MQGHTESYNGGFTLQSAAKTLWESLVRVGMSCGLIALYRRWFDRQGTLSKYLSDNSFAVYMFPPPVIIGLALLLRRYDAPAPVVAGLLTASAAIVTFLLAGFVLRRLPLLRSIL